MIKNNKQITITVDNITALRNVGYTNTDILVIGVCLTLTDDCWCSTVATSEIINILGISERSFYYLLRKLKGFGVEKIFHRYNYSNFVKILETLTKSIDNSLES